MYECVYVYVCARRDKMYIHTPNLVYTVVYMYVHVHVGIQCSYIHVHAPNLVLVISFYYGL